MNFKYFGICSDFNSFERLSSWVFFLSLEVFIHRNPLSPVLFSIADDFLSILI